MNEASPAYVFIVACEDERHLQVCRTIMRRCLERIDWLADHLTDESWILEKVTDAVRRFREQFPKRFGSPLHGRGEGPDARMVRAQLLLWHARGWPFEAGVIARDIDRQPARRQAAADVLTSVRKAVSLTKPILLAHPDPEVEAWFLAGFEPRDAQEHARLEAERRRLGFDPTQRPHQLTSGRQHDDRDAKRVLDALTQGQTSRVLHCLECDLAEWRRRGERTGLAAFVAACEVELPAAFETRE
jgi:hypothetical protein